MHVVTDGGGDGKVEVVGEMVVVQVIGLEVQHGTDAGRVLPPRVTPGQQGIASIRTGLDMRQSDDYDSRHERSR